MKATAGVLSWVAQLVWAPRDQISDVYAQALVGILVLAIGLVAWLVIFKAAWRAGAAAHWRRARFALDGLATRGSRVRSFGWCGVLLVFGGLPLLVVVILVAAPGVLSPRSVAEAISVALAVAFMVPPIAVAVTAPAFWDYAAALDPNDDRDFVLVGRLLAPLTFIFSIWVFLKIGTALWPYTTPTATAAIATGVWLVHAVSWQVFSIRRLQSTLARFAIAVIPPAGTLVWTLRPSATVNGWSVLFVYNVVAIACSPLAVYAHDPAVLRDGLKAAGRVIGRSLLDSMWWRTIRTAWDRISNRSPGRGTLSR